MQQLQRRFIHGIIMLSCHVFILGYSKVITKRTELPMLTLSDHLHHDLPDQKALQRLLHEAVQHRLPIRPKPKAIHPTPNVQDDLLKRRQTPQQNNQSHPDSAIVLVFVVPEVHVSHTAHLAARALPKADNLDVVADLLRDDGEEVLDGVKADFEEVFREWRQRRNPSADLAADAGEGEEGGERLRPASPGVAVADLEGHAVGTIDEDVHVVALVAAAGVVLDCVDLLYAEDEVVNPVA